MIFGHIKFLCLFRSNRQSGKMNCQVRSRKVELGSKESNSAVTPIIYYIFITDLVVTITKTPFQGRINLTKSRLPPFFLIILYLFSSSPLGSDRQSGQIDINPLK